MVCVWGGGGRGNFCVPLYPTGGNSSTSPHIHRKSQKKQTEHRPYHNTVTAFLRVHVRVEWVGSVGGDRTK